MNSRDIGTTRAENIFAQASLSLEVFAVVLEVMEKYSKGELKGQKPTGQGMNVNHAY